MKKTLILMVTIFMLLCGTEFAESIDLGWDANTDPIDGYIVYRSLTSGNNYIQVDVVPCTANDPVCCEYIGEELAWETTFYWVVTAFKSPSGQSGFSNEVTYTTPPEPLPSPPKNPTGCFIKSVNN